MSMERDLPSSFKYDQVAKVDYGFGLLWAISCLMRSKMEIKSQEFVVDTKSSGADGERLVMAHVARGMLPAVCCFNVISLVRFVLRDPKKQRCCCDRQEKTGTRV